MRYKYLVIEIALGTKDGAEIFYYCRCCRYDVLIQFNKYSKLFDPFRVDGSIEGVHRYVENRQINL